MRYIILFEDASDADPGLRMKNMPAHLDFLESATPEVLSAGPQRDGDGQPAGGLWIVKAESLVEVEALIRRDPLFATGLRKSWTIRAWTRVFDNGRRLPRA